MSASPGDVGKDADSDSVGLGWGPRLCISNRSPDDADTAALHRGHTLRNKGMRRRYESLCQKEGCELVKSR